MMAHLGEDSSSQNEDGAVCFLVDPENFDGDLSDGNTILYTGQTVQLEDGSTAILQPGVSTDDLHEFKLEDGSIAYLALNVPVIDTSELETSSNGQEAEGLMDTLQVTMEEEHEETLGEKYVYRYGFVELEETTTEEIEGDVRLGIKDSSGESFEEPSSVSGQQSATQKPLKSFVCQEEGCGKIYSAHHHLKVHARSHTGSRPFSCVEPGCGKMFRTNYALKAHVRTHTGEKPYKCPSSDCGKSFKTSGDLQKHIRTHTGERPFKCPIPGCDRAFTTSNIRKVHLRTHTGERPYECTEPGCNRAFASATNFKNHMRIHSGEKPYVCANKSCGRRFTEYSSLYKHQTVHTQNKPFECQDCGRHYRQSSTLTMHRRTAHNIIQTVDGTEVMLALPLPLSLQSGSAKLDSYAFVEVERDSAECLVPIEGVKGSNSGDGTLSMPSGSESDDTSHLDDSSLTQILVVDQTDDGLLAVECFDDEQVLA